MTKTSSLLAGLIAGGLIGAVAGLLAAPKSGKETRELVGTRATEVRNRAGEYIGTLRERFKKDRAEEGVEEHSENGVQTHS